MLEGWVPYAIIGAIAVALVAATVVLARLAWRRQVRTYIVGLMGRRESIGAALKTAESTVSTLARGSVEDLLAFATGDSEERRAVAEIAERMRMQAAELADLALPKHLWALANTLGAAATSLAEQAGGVGDSEGDAVLDALAALELGTVRDALAESDEVFAIMSEAYDLTDPSVYGGGLYI